MMSVEKINYSYRLSFLLKKRRRRCFKPVDGTEVSVKIEAKGDSRVTPSGSAGGALGRRELRFRRW